MGAHPEWVVPLDPNLATPAPFAGPIRPGVFFRLVDFQVNAESGEEYYHFVNEFLTVAGVHDHSDFRIEIDPAYQSLTLHRIRLHRRGVEHDLYDPASVRVTVPEEEWEDGLLDGHVSLLFVLKDVRPGDIVEYDYTLSGRNPAFDGRFFDSIALEWETSVAAMRYRLVKDTSRPLQVRNHRLELAPARRSLPGGLEEWLWERRGIPARRMEDQVPAWYQPLAHVELSEFSDWAEVAAWGAAHYDVSREDIDPALAAEIAAIRGRHDTPDERALAAIRFVQDSVRYLGIEDGANAFHPAQPGQCFRRRFGDCKDKAVLLAQMLRALGIESDPVCVSQGRRRAVADRLPSPVAFDHVINRIRMPDGREIWCDATLSHQGGDLDSLFFPDFGKGLVLRSDTRGLHDLPAPDPARHRMEIVEAYRIGGIGAPTEIEIETVHTGSEADDLRYQIETEEPETVRRHYLDYYRENHDAIESLGPIEVRDDRRANRLVTRERYRIPDPWTPDPNQSEEGWHSLTVYLQGIRDLLDQPGHSRRLMPLATAHPVNRRHELRLQLPGTHEDWEGFFDDPRQEINAPGARFARWIQYDGATVSATIVGTFQSTADHVTPPDLAAHRTALASIYESSAIDLWEIQSARPGEAAGQPAGSALSGGTDPTGNAFPLAVLAGLGMAMAGLLGVAAGALATALLLRSRRSAPRVPVPPRPGGPPPLPLPPPAPRRD